MVVAAAGNWWYYLLPQMNHFETVDTDNLLLKIQTSCLLLNIDQCTYKPMIENGTIAISRRFSTHDELSWESAWRSWGPINNHISSSISLPPVVPLANQKILFLKSHHKSRLCETSPSHLPFTKKQNSSWKERWSFLSYHQSSPWLPVSKVSALP